MQQALRVHERTELRVQREGVDERGLSFGADATDSAGEGRSFCSLPACLLAYPFFLNLLWTWVE